VLLEDLTNPAPDGLLDLIVANLWTQNEKILAHSLHGWHLMPGKDDHIADVLRIFNDRADTLTEARLLERFQSEWHSITRFARLQNAMYSLRWLVSSLAAACNREPPAANTLFAATHIVTVKRAACARRGIGMAAESPIGISPPGRLPAPASLLRGAQRLVRTHAFRLAGLYFLVFAASVLGVLFFVYWTSADFVERQTEATLDAEVTGLAEQYAQRGISGLVQIVAARSAGDRGDGMLYLVTSQGGRPLAGNISGWPAGVKTRPGPVSFDIEIRAKGETRTHPARGVLFAIPEGYRLLVGRDISDAAAFRNRIRTTLWWSGLVALGIGLLGGTVMSRNMLRRVEQVNRTAERVIAGNLSDRVPRRRGGAHDEFDQLAANLNSMLDQIERLMTAMREVTDNVAHDLKTPLARLRARLELTLLGPADPAAQGEAVRAAIDEADRLLATFNALLGIAEAEAGAGRFAGERLDLGEVARAVVELYEPVAEEQGISLRLADAPGTAIRGDRHLLSQALANLIDNALKHGGNGYGGGGAIAIAITRQDSGGAAGAAIEVADCGQGIPEGDRESVFDRFVRLEPSRSRPGNGLGLSLVRAVARRHGATVTLAESQPGAGQPGLKVRIEFPAWSQV
jgi:signal transduction histidine kinase